MITTLTSTTTTTTTTARNKAAANKKCSSNNNNVLNSKVKFVLLQPNRKRSTDDTTQCEALKNKSLKKSNNVNEPQKPKELTTNSSTTTTTSNNNLTHSRSHSPRSVKDLINLSIGGTTATATAIDTEKKEHAEVKVKGQGAETKETKNESSSSVRATTPLIDPYIIDVNVNINKDVTARLLTTCHRCLFEPQLLTKEQTQRCIQLQAWMRGTLARWNVRVLQLEQKLQAIRALKEKQLKKIQQRQVQKQQSLRVEMEHCCPHRVEMRLLEKAKTVRHYFVKQRNAVVTELNALYKEQLAIKAQNQELARSVLALTEHAKAKRREILALNFEQRELEQRVRHYKTVVDTWKTILEENLPLPLTVLQDNDQVMEDQPVDTESDTDTRTESEPLQLSTGAILIGAASS